MTLPIAVIANNAAGGISPSTREACTAAQQIADVTGQNWGVVVPGPVDASIADVGCVIEVGGEELKSASCDVKAAMIAEVCKDNEVVLMTGTVRGNDLMGRVAQHLDVPMASDCVGLDLRGGSIRFKRALYGGKVLSTVRIDAVPAMATFRPRTFGQLPAGESTAAILNHKSSVPESRVSVEYVAQAVKDSLDVTEADIVVSGGRGMQGPEHWAILEDLVAVLGPRATLACSRPVSDDGWRPRSEHVGQTGRAITPDLYIACGISGAIQHVAGIARSKFIVAINKDPEAPIFKVADYGIVGDLFEVVPELTAAIRSLP